MLCLMSRYNVSMLGSHTLPTCQWVASHEPPDLALRQKSTPLATPLRHNNLSDQDIAMPYIS